MFNLTGDAPQSEECRAPASSKAYTAQQIDFDTAYKFREFHYDRKDWLRDNWDEHSTHYGYFLHGELAGILRVVHPVDSALPVSSYVPGFVVRPGDCQIGRLLVAPEFRGTKILAFMMHHFEHDLTHAGSRIILTPRESINISPERFERWGFTMEKAGFDTQQGLVRNLWVRDNSSAQGLRIDDDFAAAHGKLAA